MSNERLSEQTLADVLLVGDASPETARSMAIEIQQRRAADLTAADLDAVRRARRLARGEVLAASGMRHAAPSAQATVDALDKILHAHGVTP